MVGKRVDEIMEIIFGSRWYSVDSELDSSFGVDAAVWQPARWWLTTVSHILLTLIFISIMVDQAVNHWFFTTQFILDFTWLIFLPSALVALILVKYLHKRGYTWYHLVALVMTLYVGCGLILVNM